MVDTPLQYCMDIGDCAFGLADSCPPFQEGGPKGDNTPQPHCEGLFQSAGELLLQVEEFKYLGILFTSEVKMKRETERQTDSSYIGSDADTEAVQCGEERA